MQTPEQTDRDIIFQRNVMTSFIRIAALVIVASYCLRIVSPFLSIVIWGVVLAVAVYPLHLRLAGMLGGRPRTSASLIAVVGLLVLLVPGWLVAESALDTARSVAAQIHDGSLDIPPPNPRVADWPVVGDRLYRVWSEGAADLDAALAEFRPQVKRAGEWLLHAAGGFAVGLLHFAASVIIAGICLLYARSGYALSLAINRRLTPRGTHLTDLSIATVRSVTNGVLGVAVIQAVFAGIGFAVMGVPAAGVLAIVVLVTAIIQIPAILVMLPPILWAFSSAEPLPAALFSVYVIVVALSDNLLKPMLLGRGVDLPVLVVAAVLSAAGALLERAEWRGAARHVPTRLRHAVEVVWR